MWRSNGFKRSKKINAKLKFLYRQSRYLSPAYRRLLCNALIQSHFDYGCSSWFPILKKNKKKKLQKAQNKCTRFYLNSRPRSHIHPVHYRKLTGFRLVTEQNTELRILFLSTEMELQDIFMKCLSLHSADIAQEQIALDIPLRKPNTNTYPSQGQKHGPKQTLVSKMLEHRLLLLMLFRKIFSFICKANLIYYHILMIEIII